MGPDIFLRVELRINMTSATPRLTRADSGTAQALRTPELPRQGSVARLVEGEMNVSFPFMTCFLYVSRLSDQKDPQRQL